MVFNRRILSPFLARRLWCCGDRFVGAEGTMAVSGVHHHATQGPEPVLAPDRGGEGQEVSDASARGALFVGDNHFADKRASESPQPWCDMM